MVYEDWKRDAKDLLGQADVSTNATGIESDIWECTQRGGAMEWDIERVTGILQKASC